MMVVTSKSRTAAIDTTVSDELSEPRRAATTPFELSCGLSTEPVESPPIQTSGPRLSPSSQAS